MILCLLIQLVSPGMTTFAETVKAIDHTLVTNETDNMCYREHEGKLKFQWPLHKKKIDFVIIQDVSVSFKDSIGSVKKALK